MQLSLFDDPVAAPTSNARSGPATKATPLRPDPKRDYCDWEEARQWMAERYEHLHLWVLKRNLRILNESNTCDEERADILAWINAPVDDADVLRPFTFHACLMLYDPRLDTETIQAALSRLNQQVLQRQRERAA
ncbi:MAG: hypothetical protein KDK04_03280 [Candidatus Competibacteraceae bacterium]|nr:hypothetical protein [Candidatus Competibacteraceae bacterium]